MSGSHGSVTFYQTNTPMTVNTFELGDTPKKIYGRLNAGGTIQLMPNAVIDAGLTMTLGKKGNEEAPHVGLSIGF